MILLKSEWPGIDIHLKWVKSMCGAALHPVSRKPITCIFELFSERSLNSFRTLSIVRACMPVVTQGNTEPKDGLKERSAKLTSVDILTQII